MLETLVIILAILAVISLGGALAVAIASYLHTKKVAMRNKQEVFEAIWKELSDDPKWNVELNIRETDE